MRVLWFVVACALAALLPLLLTQPSPDDAAPPAAIVAPAPTVSPRSVDVVEHSRLRRPPAPSPVRE
jgi:hypothetical protein